MTEETQKGSSTVAQLVAHTVSGPIPPPEDMERYERIHTGAAERILTMAEKEAEVRHKTMLLAAQAAHDDVSSARTETRIGQFLSFFLTMAAFVVAAYCAKLGATKIGVTVAGVTLVSVVSTLVNRKRHS